MTPTNNFLIGYGIFITFVCLMFFQHCVLLRSDNLYMSEQIQALKTESEAQTQRFAVAHQEALKQLESAKEQERDILMSKIPQD